MAATWGGFINVVALAVLVQVAAAATYTVGGSEGGWDLSTDLQTWASAQTFVLGDSLSFAYAPSHDVVEVTKAEYDACTASRPIQSYTGGSTVIKLSAPGKRHFICGIAGHCTAGMKLEVDVVSAAAAAAATPPPVPTPTNPEAPAASHGPRSPGSSPLGSATSTGSSSSEPPAVDLVLAPVSPPPSQSAADGVGHPKLAIGLTMGMLMTVVL
ncbi:mavicyanin-like [Musa acuminata AAA Group]|uniref:mavicyanin-like n=1 Tax=Musa acuminata AAA Group TaxID=214697 RepID=UPI0031DCA210